MKYKRVQHKVIPGRNHELTFSCYHNQGYPTDDNMRNYFIHALAKAREKYGFKIIAYVVMLDHVHLLINPDAETYNISLILSSIKSSVAMKATQLSKKSTNERMVHFWQRGGGYDRNIISKEALKSSIEYIHNNPVRRGLVDSPEKWYWSSAGYYAGLANYALRMDIEMLGVLF